jgi:hypothetical protein
MSRTPNEPKCKEYLHLRSCARPVLAVSHVNLLETNEIRREAGVFRVSKIFTHLSRERGADVSREGGVRELVEFCFRRSSRSRWSFNQAPDQDPMRPTLGGNRHLTRNALGLLSIAFGQHVKWYGACGCCQQRRERKQRGTNSDPCRTVEFWVNRDDWVSDTSARTRPGNVSQGIASSSWRRRSRRRR